MVFLYDVESVKNRPDKTVLNIHSQCPDLLLAPEVASPELVKHLVLDLSFRYLLDCQYDPDFFKYRREGVFCNCKCEEGTCEKCDWWGKAYTDTLCKDLVNFTNLETFVACDVKLSAELWIQFAKNSKCLKTLTFDSDARVVAGEYDDIRFGAYDDQQPKNAALDALVKIPTLKHLSFDRLNMRYFPPGPSSIESLHLNVVDIEKHEYVEAYDNLTNFKSSWNDLGFSSSFDLSGHQNLKDVSIERLYYIKFSDLHLEKLKNLESLVLVDYFYNDFRDEKNEKVLKIISMLPNIKSVRFKSN
jgi:hypothetical protein